MHFSPSYLEARIEVRAAPKGQSLLGTFVYGKIAVVSDRGRVRKERFMGDAFQFAVRDEKRDITLLHGHNHSQPLANRSGGSLNVSSSKEAVQFEATLPDPSEQPTWMQDTVLAVRAGLITGISPGFKVPPGRVQNPIGSGQIAAEEFVPDPDNPAVMIRQINAAVLHELSLVSRPAYKDTSIEVRSDNCAYRMRLIRAAYGC